MKNRNVQIPYELFFQPLQYFLMEYYESEEIIRQGLERKLDTMVNRELYEKDEVIKSLRSLLEFYDVNGQGYQMYITLMGTGRSRAGLTHHDSLQTITSLFSLYSEKIHGDINIVIYKKDRDKVSIFD